MVKASALYIVIVVTLIIGILCSSLINIAYYQRLQVQRNLLIKRLHINSESGINLLLGDYDRIAMDETILDLYGEERDSVILKKSNWGIYNVASVCAFSKSLKSVKSVLYGYTIDSDNKIALYLSDQNEELKISGKTNITGKVYLPEAGVKSIPFEGENFIGNKLVNGEIKKSQSVLPKLNNSITKSLLNQLSGLSTSPDQTIIDIAEEDTLINSFYKNKVIINASSVKRLQNKQYQGNIVIYSSSIIEIDSSCKLTDIIVYAPSIIINGGFVGSIQAFCTDSIVVRENSHLLYPSALGLVKKDFRIPQPFIKIKDKAVVSGVLFSYMDVQDQLQSLISISKEALIEGQVYADGFLELKGKVHGSVYCNKFYIRTPSSTNTNVILNGEVNFLKLSDYYIGSSLIGFTNYKRIVKWIE